MRVLSKYFALFSMLSATLFVNAASAEHIVYSVERVIKVDGKLDEWNDAIFVKVNKDNGLLDKYTKRLDGDDDLSFEFSVAYDSECFYVAVRVYDDVLVTDSCEPGSINAPAWDDDAVEIFIDGNANGAIDSRANNGAELKFGGEFSLVANGAAMSDYSGYPMSFGKLWHGAVSATKRDSGGYEVCYEFKMPWSVCGLTEKPQKIGFNISVQDDDDGGRRDSALYWCGNVEKPFIDESKFGTIYFNK